MGSPCYTRLETLKSGNCEFQAYDHSRTGINNLIFPWFWLSGLVFLSEIYFLHSPIEHSSLFFLSICQIFARFSFGESKLFSGNSKVEFQGKHGQDDGF